MSFKSYKEKIQKRTYPFSWLQPSSSVLFQRSIYLSIIYLLIVCLLISGIHGAVLFKGTSKNCKFWLSSPFPIIIITLLVLNKQYSSLIVSVILLLSILTFASLHQVLTSNFPNTFSEVCIFEEKESFMFMPFWMLNLYLVAFTCIFIIYELVNYYSPLKTERKKKVHFKGYY